MNDTVATEDQKQPVVRDELEARKSDRGSGRRTSSGPADMCAAPPAGHMTATDQTVQRKKSACHEVVHICLTGSHAEHHLNDNHNGPDAPAHRKTILLKRRSERTGG